MSDPLAPVDAPVRGRRSEADTNLFRPTQPLNFPVRPLNRGIRLDQPAQLLPPGAMVEVLNFITNLDGLRRRPALEDAFSGAAVGYPPVTDLLTAWSSGGIQTTLVLDDNFLYAANNLGLTGIYSTYTTGTIEVTGAPTTTVTGTGTLWITPASDVQADDVIVLDADDSSGNREEHVIDSVGSDVAITTATQIQNNHPAGTDYEIRRAFQSGEPYITDWTIVGPNPAVTDQVVVFADFNRPLFGYNVSTGVLTNAFDTGTLQPIAATCEYFGQRLFIAHTIEGANEFRQRVRWTSPLDRTNFDDSASGTGFIDLAFTQGAIRRLLGLGSLLVAYFEDAIFLGRPTNIPGLPVQFERLETGGVGLGGIKAVTRWLGAHFFIGQDDIYALTNRGVERIGTPVVRKTVREADRLLRCYAAADPRNDRIVFGFPKGTNEMVDVWSFDYKAKAWSHDSITTEMISNEGVIPGVTWDSLFTGGHITTDDWDVGMDDFGSWDAIDPVDPGVKNLFYAQSGVIRRLRDDGGSDVAVGIISGTLETADFDFGNPDVDKLYNRLSLKLRDPTPLELTFTVTASTDRAFSFKSVGTITIPANTDEAYINFRVTGSIVRFRLTTAVDIDPYVITEMVVRARHRGLETAGG